MKASTGLRNYMLGTGSLAAALAEGVIRVYSNAAAAPATADAALPGGAVLLAEISDNNTGDGLDFGAALNGVISKSSSQIWSGEAVESGTAQWFRHVLPGDDGSASTSAPRIQGSIGLAGADLNLQTVTFVAEEIYPITAYNVALPT